MFVHRINSKEDRTHPCEPADDLTWPNRSPFTVCVLLESPDYDLTQMDLKAYKLKHHRMVLNAEDKLVNSKESDMISVSFQGFKEQIKKS